MRHPNLWLGLLLAPLAAQAAPPLTLPRVNLLSNPSFEWDQEVGQRVVQDGYAFGWGLWGQENVYGVYSPRSVPSFAAGAVEGARAQQIAWQADGTTLLHVNQDVHQVKPSLAYTLSAYVKAEPADAAEFDVMINFINAKGEWTDAGASRPIRAAEWTRLSLTGTTPADISWVRCIIHAKPTKPGAQATLWVDAAQFEEGSTATEFTPCYRVGEFVTVMQPTEKSFPNKLSWLAAQPSGTDLRFQLRSARTEAALADAPWQGPEGADAYALAVDSGPNLLPDPSVEQEGGDDPPRELAWGDNDHPFTATAEAHTGQRALQARITRFGGGAARYGVPYAGELQPNQRYSFAVWHREDSPQTPVQMSVSLELADGTMRWGRFGQSKPGSAAWRRDRIVFTTPAQPLRRVLLELVLLGQGTVTSDDYDLAWSAAATPGRSLQDRMKRRGCRRGWCSLDDRPGGRPGAVRLEVVPRRHRRDRVAQRRYGGWVARVLPLPAWRDGPVSAAVRRLRGPRCAGFPAAALTGGQGVHRHADRGGPGGPGPTDRPRQLHLPA
jgi:hypothetical protein